MGDHLTGEKILDTGQIEPSFRGCHIGNAGDPDVIRACGHDRLGQGMFRHQQRVLKIHGDREPAHLCAAKAQLLAQSLNAPDLSRNPSS